MVQVQKALTIAFIACQKTIERPYDEVKMTVIN